jgi:hypothetical protein
MWSKWSPWRFLIRRLARSHGFLDPFQWLSRMRGFAHPSEVTEPVELLRAGVLFHARGLINTKAIQHNLDWVWPYWVERQFNPADVSFIPRAFSFSHINLTHRNWTAVGLPDVPFYPVVDPRGLVTPFHDSWSLDFWLVEGTDRRLLPSKLECAEQKLGIDGNLVVSSRFEQGDWILQTEVFMEMNGDSPQCVIRLSATAPASGLLAVAIRPYNPEGISFIDSIDIAQDRRHWRVNDRGEISFNREPEKCLFSTYREGDVSHMLDTGKETAGSVCAASMATGAALFSLARLDKEPLEVRVLILDERTQKPAMVESTPPDWPTELAKCSRLQVSDPLVQQLYDTAVASVILHSPGEVYPGPYTYKRFWYRDAAFILNALITLGAHERVKCALDLFPRGQTLQGYFRSQEGEWDSNGEVLWIIHRYLQLTGTTLPSEWTAPIEKGANWILKKRLPKDLAEPHAGLLPAGFSAEHLGPNDYYYWDDFWGVAGLRCAGKMLEPTSSETARSFADSAEEFLQTIVSSFKHIPTRRFKGAISASPHRRMDAGAVGSLVADYPLQLFAPGDARLMKTTEYLLEHSSFDGGFFQNMIHSGINAYLTLHLAQVLLRAGDSRALKLVDTVARLASPTGQWPEAIHPRSGGGCMGDGQHIWAAADWAMMIRNLFVREEGGSLVLGTGLFPRWLAKREPLFFGPTLTPFGPVTVRVEPDSRERWLMTLEIDPRGRGTTPPQIKVQVPGHSRVTTTASPNQFLIEADA